MPKGVTYYPPPPQLRTAEGTLFLTLTLRAVSQEQHSYGGYSTNRPECPKKEEDDLENQGHFTFKTEAKDYKYAGGEMYSDVYNLMRQPPSLAEYSSSRGAAGLSYAGGYYDHMCLAL